MSNVVLTTERLRLVPFAEEDYSLFLGLHSDPEVNRFLSPGPQSMSEMEARQKLSTYMDAHERNQISKWKLETVSGEFLGRAGFSWQQDPASFEMGYSLKRAAWGMGYATEIARGLVSWFFKTMPDDHLIAYSASEHKSSQNVMVKSGMKFWKEMEKHGVACRFFRITREEYLQDQILSAAVPA
ncbi:anhydro-N-acetylmuramic acid kinase [Roseibium album]|nr:anhydro-N-acetylmuramic acid kinase [Roseibium album]